VSVSLSIGAGLSRRASPRGIGWMAVLMVEISTTYLCAVYLFIVRCIYLFIIRGEIIYLFFQWIVTHYLFIITHNNAGTTRTLAAFEPRLLKTEAIHIYILP
jgi:hypothetical protein